MKGKKSRKVFGYAVLSEKIKNKKYD